MKPKLAELVKEHTSKKRNEHNKCQEALSKAGGKDSDGYPTVEMINYVVNWFGDYEASKIRDLLRDIKSIWHFKAFGWYQEVEEKPDETLFRYHVSTLGWSGNEALITALQTNSDVWEQIWVQSRRGGHYIFEVIVPTAS